MFDLRYHVASLAAVFLALAIGILLGVAISGEVSDTRDSLQQREVADLRGQLEAEQAGRDADQRRREAADELAGAAYPVVMDRRLEGRRVAVVFLGPVDRAALAGVEAALRDADAGGPVRSVALNLPVDAEQLDAFLAADEDLAAYAAGGDDFEDLGDALGRELVTGGEVPLLSAVSSQLIEQRSGTDFLPADAVVVVASWAPADDQAASPEADATQSLVEGVLGGLESAGLPVVGVATSTEPTDETDVYRSRGLSSVDDVDLLAGRVALAVLLAGGESGHYGVKNTASDGIVPPIPPVPVESAPAE